MSQRTAPPTSDVATAPHRRPDRGASDPSPVPLVEPATPASPRAVVCVHHDCQSDKGLGQVRHPQYGKLTVCWEHALELLQDGGEWA